jgi:amino acid transporter
MFNTVAKLVPLLILMAAGLFLVNVDNLVILDWPSVAEVGAGAIILFFAFSGAECALSASGEIRRPSRTVPLGLAYGVGGLLLLYVGLQTVAQGVLGPELATQTDAPLSAAAVRVLGEWGGTLLLTGLVISIYGAVSGDILGVPRVIFASSRDGSLPRVLSRVHPAYRTPYVAVIFYAIVVCVLALTGTFRYLAVVATGSLLLIDLGVILAVPVLRRRDGLPAAGQFRLPFGLLVPALAALVVCWLLIQLPAGEALSVAALGGAAMIFYAIRMRVVAPRAGA